MKHARIFIIVLAAMLMGVAASIKADDVTPTLVGASDIKAGMRLYFECGPHTSTADYRGKYIVAHPELGSPNTIKCDEAISDAALWTLEATGAYDAKYTDKPTYYLKDVTTGKYFGAASTTTSINQTDKRMVDGTDLAYTFCFLSKADIDSKEGRSMNVYGNEKAVFIHHSNASETEGTDGTWFRLSRFGANKYVDYISSTNYSTNNDWQAWNVYTIDAPNDAKAAEGIAALQEYYDEVQGYYALMTSADYDDVAFDAAQRAALEAKLSEAATALSETPSGENSYYTDLRDELKAVYEQVPYVEGGKKYWAINAADLTNGSLAMFESAPGANGVSKFMVANTSASGQNAVLCSDGGKSAAAIWQLEATGGYDKIYTDKPTYYLKDVSSGLYFGASDLTSLDPTAKQMVSDKTKAYPFSFLTIDDVKAKQNITVNGYGNDGAVIIHYSVDEEKWLRPSRFGANDYVFYINSNNYPTNTMWPAWNVYTGEQNLSISEELTEALAEYGSKTFSNVGSDPGCFDESKVTPYTKALAAAKALTASNTRQEIRTAIDNMKAAYETIQGLEVLPVTDGYYYIESAWSSLAGQTVRACDPDDASGLLNRKSYTEPDKYAVFYIKEEAAGQFSIQNLGSGLYVGQQVSTNNVTLVEEKPTESYHIFTYDAEGQFKWRDNTTASWFYYIKTYGDNAIGRNVKQATSGSDAWLLKRVPDAVIKKLINGSTDEYGYDEGTVTASGEIDLSALKAFIDEQESVTSVDLTAATLPDGTTADQLTALVSGTNALIYVGEAANLSGTNIVSNGTCANLVLTDGQDFAAPTAFTATKASYSRAMGNEWGTICLPYAVSGDETTEYYTISEVKDNVLVVSKVEGELAAGTPALVRKVSGTGIEPTATSVPVSATISAPAGAVQMYGAIEKTRVDNANAYYIKDNKFWQCNNYFYCGAFRAYFVATGGAGSSNFSIVISDDDDPTGIESQSLKDTESQSLYDLQGRKVNAPKKGQLYIKGGKVVKY